MTASPGSYLLENTERLPVASSNPQPLYIFSTQKRVLDESEKNRWDWERSFQQYKKFTMKLWKERRVKLHSPGMIWDYYHYGHLFDATDPQFLQPGPQETTEDMRIWLCNQQSPATVAAIQFLLLKRWMALWFLWNQSDNVGLPFRLSFTCSRADLCRMVSPGGPCSAIAFAIGRAIDVGPGLCRFLHNFMWQR